MSNMIITINRENGSGGREIAHLLGEKLNLKVYDKAILEAVAQKYNLTKEEIERIKAQKVNLWDEFCQFYRQFSAAGNSYQNEDRKITSRELYYTEAQIMRNLASQESCIIVGRSGFHVFKDDPNALRIFIMADLDARIKRIAEKQGIDEKTAAKYIKDTDAARDSFTKTFAGTSRYDARNYDMTLNVGHFGADSVATFLAENIKRRMQAEQ